MEAYFRKNFVRSLDSKGRLMLPPEYRDIISAMSGASGFKLTCYDDKCIVVYPKLEWAAFAEQLEQLKNPSSALRNFRSVFVGRAEDLELDAQGRVRISQSMMRYAGLSKDAKLVGLGSKFEIWDMLRFEGLKIDDTARDVAFNELGQSGIEFSL